MLFETTTPTRDAVPSNATTVPSPFILLNQLGVQHNIIPVHGLASAKFAILFHSCRKCRKCPMLAHNPYHFKQKSRRFDVSYPQLMHRWESFFETLMPTKAQPVVKSEPAKSA